MIAALFVERGGCYWGLPDVDPWDIARDARNYPGPWPVVAHPPCNLWTRFAHVNYKRWGGEHNRPGNDGGCFAFALSAIKKWGGVLEHPAFSDAWKHFSLPRPVSKTWRYADGYWVCEVWQSAYGHKAQKRTWLAYCGSPPQEMRWEQLPGTHQIGGYCVKSKNNKPTISGKAASATPIAFRDALLSLARGSKNVTFSETRPEA